MDLVPLMETNVRQNEIRIRSLVRFDMVVSLDVVVHVNGLVDVIFGASSARLEDYITCGDSGLNMEMLDHTVEVQGYFDIAMARIDR